MENKIEKKTEKEEMERRVKGRGKRGWREERMEKTRERRG